MAVSETFALPKGTVGPHGGDSYRFDYFDSAGVAADRSVAAYADVTELLAGAAVATTRLEGRRLGFEAAIGIVGLSAAAAKAMLLNQMSY